MSFRTARKIPATTFCESNGIRKKDICKGFRTGPEFKTFFALVQPYVNDIEEMHHTGDFGGGEIVVGGLAH